MPDRKKYVRQAQAQSARKGRGVSAWFIMHQFDWRGMTYQIHRSHRRNRWHVTGCPTLLQNYPAADECKRALRAFLRHRRLHGHTMGDLNK